MLCKNCGAMNDDDARFCEVCGAAIDYSDLSGQSNGSQHQANNPPQGGGQPKKNSETAIIVGVLLTVLVIVIIIISIVVARSQSSRDESNSWGLTVETTSGENLSGLQSDVHGTETAFYGIVCGRYSSKEETEKDINALIGAGFTDAVYCTASKWENFGKNGYLVVAGRYSSEQLANANLEVVKKYFQNAYVLYSGERVTEASDSGLTTGPATATNNDSEHNSEAMKYLKDAENALKEGNRQTAYDLATEALKISPDDEYVKERVSYFESYLPFEFYNEKNVLSQKTTEEVDSIYTYLSFGMNEKSNNGKSMPNSILAHYYIGSACKVFSVTYHLDYDYDVLSGVGFVLDDYQDVEHNGYFKIYGDGKELFTSKKYGVNVLPEDFSVNIKGVSTIVIEFYGENENYNMSAFGISDLVALKNID